MKKTLKFATALLATTMFCSAVQAAETHQPDAFLDGLVKAALPKDDSVEGLVNSGSLGVTLYLLCEIGKSTGGDQSGIDKCPN